MQVKEFLTGHRYPKVMIKITEQDTTTTTQGEDTPDSPPEERKVPLKNAELIKAMQKHTHHLILRKGTPERIDPPQHLRPADLESSGLGDLQKRCYVPVLENHGRR